MCANFDFVGQKVKSPGQVKVRCALRDQLQTWRSCCAHSFSPNVFKLWGWNIGVDTYRMQILDFSFEWPQVRSIFDPAHYKPKGEIRNDSPAHNFWTKGDKRMKWVPKCFFFVPPNQMMPNMTNVDLIWHVTPNWTGDQILKLAFLGPKLSIIRFFSTRETR